MQFTPKKDKRAKSVSYILMATALIALVTSIMTKFSYHVLVDVLALGLFVYAFEVFNRYILTTFTYGTDGKDFVILKTTGKKQEYVCNLSMKTVLAIHPYDKENKMTEKIEKSYGKIGYRYNYAQKIGRTDTYSVFFSFNDTVAEIIFEPNEALVKAIESGIAAAENEDSETF